MYFINGDYASAGPQFNTRNNALPDAGRTFRFLPLVETILPVTLTDFTAKSQGNAVLLTWNTANEQNNKNFEIQSSQNGTNFNTAGIVSSKGSGAHAYYFEDAKPNTSNGSVYYRLKQNDIDGSTEFSSILKIDILETAGSFSIKPIGKFTNTIDLKVTAKEKGRIGLFLFNALGAKVMQTELPVNEGSNMISIGGLPKLQYGTYFLQCRIGSEVKTIQLVKQ